MMIMTEVNSDYYVGYDDDDDDDDASDSDDNDSDDSIFLVAFERSKNAY